MARVPGREFFKAVAPFSLASSLAKGIVTPMSLPAYALTLVSMHVWAMIAQNRDLVLPSPVYEDLYQAFKLLEKAFELESVLPAAQRRIPHEVHEEYAKTKTIPVVKPAKRKLPVSKPVETTNPPIVRPATAPVVTDTVVQDYMIDYHTIRRHPSHHHLPKLT